MEKVTDDKNCGGFNCNVTLTSAVCSGFFSQVLITDFLDILEIIIIIIITIIIKIMLVSKMPRQLLLDVE